MSSGKIQLPVPQRVLKICRILNKNGFQAYIVGGAIRDLLLNKQPTDWDLTTDALPQQVQEIFPKTILTGERFGTVTVVIDQSQIEVTTMRRDANYSDGRRPDYVRFSSDIITDLERRDFTINAIAYDPISNDLIDPQGGLGDLKRKILRTVGDPKQRFQEDALRMLRLIRFMASLEFTPHRSTARSLNPKLMHNVAWERVQPELSKLLLSHKIVKPLQLLFESGLLTEMIPELAQGAKVYQGDRHQWDVLGHSIMTAQAIKPELHLRLAALLHDVGKSQTVTSDQAGIHFYRHDIVGAKLSRTILRRLTYPKKIQTKVSLLIEYHMFSIHAHSSDKAIRRLITKVGHENIYDLFELRKADALAMKHNPRQVWEYYQAMRQRVDQIFTEFDAFSLRDLAITGTDLIQALDLPPGPLIGQILNHLFQLVVDQPQVNTYDFLIKEAQTYLSSLDQQLF